MFKKINLKVKGLSYLLITEKQIIYIHSLSYI